jgi:hypothetical protein
MWRMPLVELTLAGIACNGREAKPQSELTIVTFVCGWGASLSCGILVILRIPVSCMLSKAPHPGTRWPQHRLTRHSAPAGPAGAPAAAWNCLPQLGAASLCTPSTRQ